MQEAQRYYKTATKLDETSVAALSGIVACQLLDKQLDIARDQLDFLKEITAAGTATAANRAEILYMAALHGRQAATLPPDAVLNILNEAVDAHFKAVRGLSFGPDYLITINPDFVVLLVKEYLLYAPSSRVVQGQALPAPLKRTLIILEPVTKACPGLKDALVLLARTKYLSGDARSAVSTLQHILDNIDPTEADCHLLMAQIQLHQGNYLNAQQSLEIGLSYNFEVRDHPIYHLINARVLREQGKMEDCIKTLLTALNLVNRKRGGSGASGRQKEVASNDRVSVFLELAAAYRLTGQHTEAGRVMSEALAEVAGTPEEIRVTVAHADLALAKGEVEVALKILEAIKPEQDSPPNSF